MGVSVVCISIKEFEELMQAKKDILRINRIERACLEEEHKICDGVEYKNLQDTIDVQSRSHANMCVALDGIRGITKKYNNIASASAGRLF